MRKDGKIKEMRILSLFWSTKRVVRKTRNEGERWICHQIYQWFLHLLFASGYVTSSTPNATFSFRSLRVIFRTCVMHGRKNQQLGLQGVKVNQSVYNTISQDLILLDCLVLWAIADRSFSWWKKYHQSSTQNALADALLHLVCVDSFACILG